MRLDLKRMKIWGETTGFIIKDEAENGFEAIKKMAEQKFDLVITDIRMPVMDGLELLKFVSVEKLNTCVVLLSDYTEYSYAREGILHGAFDYLGKPVEQTKLSDLLKRVKEYLDGKNAEQKIIEQLKIMVEEAFFPKQDIDKVVMLLKQGSLKAIEALNNLVDIVGAALNYDINKSIIILKNTTEAITSQIVEEHGWICLYDDPQVFNMIDIDNIKDFTALKMQMNQLFKGIIVFLKKFIIWNESSNLVKSACLEVLMNIEDNISVKLISEKLYISKAYLSDVFKQSTGVSLLEYITMVKIERAKYLLKSTELKKYEISEKLGFADHEYFTKVFKKVTGLTPIEFKRMKKNKPLASDEPEAKD